MKWFQVEGKVYSEVGEMEAAFEADALTPQLLKPALTATMASLLDACNSRIKANPEAKKAEATIAALRSRNKKK